MSDDMNDEQIETVRVGLHELMGDNSLRPQVRRVLDRWASSAMGELLSQTGPKQYRIRYPASWWQAFKAQWFPKWLLRKYPVQYKGLIVDVDTVYPPK